MANHFSPLVFAFRKQSFRAIAVVITAVVMGEPSGWTQEANPPYKDASIPINDRVTDLINRMTLEEKASQLDMYFGCEAFLESNQYIHRTHALTNAAFNVSMAETNLGHLGIGSVHDLYPRPELYNAAQAWIIQNNRLGIPALFIEEGLHGYMDSDETVFPHSIGLATTWNPELARRTGAAIAAQARACGVGMILGPVLDVARDARWGRVEEDFGEDPFLTGQMGLAYVQGMQGENLNSDHTVIAEPKHFAGHGSPEGGLNMSPVHAGEREVRTVMLKSFEPAIREGHAMGVMAAYHDIDGVPCTGNSWLLTKVLRDEWGFQGFVLSDLGAIRRLYDTHYVVDSTTNAALMAIKAGVDMQFYDFDHSVFQDGIVNAVKGGYLPEATLNQAVARVVRAKFMLGLFDHPFVDINLDATVRHSAAQEELALESARQSMCLLKNENSLLPLKKDLGRIAVIGPNAAMARLGDYSEGAVESTNHGMLAEIKKIVSPQTEVSYADGEDIDKALELAKTADAVILGLGEWQMISGEGFDRSDLNLPGEQEKLLEAIFQTGKPVVLVLQNGRPLSITWAAGHVQAILEAWYAGDFGGRAIAETLFGDNNPAGRLSITFPRSVGQIPVFYNHFPSKKDSYIEGDSSPLFVFGHGLSYTTFAYDAPTVTAPSIQSGDDVVVAVKVTNTGNRDGDEVAQLYVRQTTASVATPVKALKGFRRIHLQAGESKTVTFNLKQADLAVWNANQQWQVEPGEYLLGTGGSSSTDLGTKFVLK